MTILTPKVYKSAFEMQPLLSDSEIELLTLLREIEIESLWGEAIKDVVKAKRVDINKFRTLVCQLLSQESDNPEMVKRIVGHEAYEKLIQLK